MLRILPVLMLLVASGCQVDYFHCDTRWNPDDSVDRAILQPVQETPGDDSSELWDEVTWTDEGSDEDFDGEIRKLPVHEERGERSQFAAWKHVGPGKPLPEHYERKGADETQVSRFNRTRQRRDLGLLAEYTWQEELTENVTLSSMHKARDELVDLTIQLVEATLAEGLGDDYEFGGIIGWLRGDGRRAFEEIADTWYEIALARRESDEDQTKRFVEIMGRYGFEFEDENNVDLKEVAAVITGKHLRRTDGKPVDLKVQQSVARLLSFEVDADESPLDAKLIKAYETFSARYPGGKDALDMKFKQLETAMLGVHGSILSGTQSFRFTMRLPGQIISTNGTLLDDSVVRWEFNGQEAFPNGYRMTVRSIEDLSGQVSGVRPFRGKRSRQRMLKLLALLDGHSNRERHNVNLVDLLKQCRKAGSLAPLKAISEKADDDENLRGDLEELWQLLQGGS